MVSWASSVVISSESEYKIKIPGGIFIGDMRDPRYATMI